MTETFRRSAILHLPMIIGILVFGAVGIYLEIAVVQGFTSANDWLTSLSLKYPPGMTNREGYNPIGNYIGMTFGLVSGGLLAKRLLAKRELK